MPPYRSDMMLGVDLQLSGKVAIVTGSSRGLGLASALALAKEGCHVTLCGRTDSTLRNAEDQVKAAGAGEGRVLAVRADVSTSDGVRAVVDRTVESFGGIDVLVNNVG